MKTIAKNLVALLCSQIASWGVTLIMLVVAPRYFGDVLYGRYNFAFSFVGFFGIVAGFGMGQFIVKETARDTSLIGPYVLNALVLKIPFIVALSWVALALAWFLGYPRETCEIIAVCCLGMGLSTISGTLAAGLQAEQRMGRTAAWVAVERYATMCAVLGTFAARLNVVIVALADVVFGVISLTANASQLLHRLRSGARLDFSLWHVLILGGAPYMVWMIALTIYGSIDVTMVSLMAGDAAVGWYVLAYRLVSAPAFLPNLVIVAFFPALSAHGDGASPIFADLANRALRLVFFVCAPMATGIALTATDIIAIFHYPAGFAHSEPLIRILALHIPLAGLGTVMGATLMARDLQRQWVTVACLAAVLNPLLNLVAIPVTSKAFGNGAVGASVVTVLTELFMLGGAIYLRPSGVFDKQSISFIARCALGSVLMLVVVLLARETPLPVRIALGIAVYLTTCLILRTLSMRQLVRSAAGFFGLPRYGNASSTL